MANVEIELNSAGIQELLKSSEIASVCEAQAARMTRAAGVEYVADVHVGRTRVNARGVDKSNGGNLNKENAGRTVSGYYRTTKSGKKVWVQSYRRKK